MNIKVIKTEDDYREALIAVRQLMAIDPDPDSVEGEQLELLATLIEDYESSMFPISLPDPIEAIKFRMEQQNLSPNDLIPYIGNKSKVSEILSRKRPLTISMIRALEKGLGIPAKVLLQDPDIHPENLEIEMDRMNFPIKEMQSRNYFEEELDKGLELNQAINQFIRSIHDSPQLNAFMKKTIYIRSPRTMNKWALMAWSKRVENIANKSNITVEYRKGTVNLDFMTKFAKLSVEQNAPTLVKDYLEHIGIALVIEPHLSQTYIDGVVILNNLKRPIIGMTIRHDRLDNFWFTLMHELAHISLDENKETSFYFDDLDVDDKENKLEHEADQLAREALIPQVEWDKSPAKVLAAQESAEDLANTLGVHTAIVAGRMRYEKKKYRYLNSLVGNGEVRKLFPNLKW